LHRYVEAQNDEDEDIDSDRGFVGGLEQPSSKEKKCELDQTCRRPVKEKTSVIDLFLFQQMPTISNSQEMRIVSYFQEVLQFDSRNFPDIISATKNPN